MGDTEFAFVVERVDGPYNWGTVTSGRIKSGAHVVAGGQPTTIMHVADEEGFVTWAAEGIGCALLLSNLAQLQQGDTITSPCRAA